MDLSILVVTYNTKNLIDACIKSILNYKGKYRIEVVVVDNKSDDGTIDFLKTKYPTIKKIFNAYNYGFAIGMNQAYRISSGRYIMTFNPDAEIYDESIDAAIEFLNSNPETGLLGMLTEDSNGNVEVPYHKFNLVEKIDFLSSLNKKHATNNEKLIGVKEVDWVWGTSIFARKEVLGETFFIEDNFLFWEEYWLCKKVKDAGFKIKILLNHKMLHHISASFKADETKLNLIRILGDVNGHKAKINEYGKIKTYISYIVKTIDHFLMYLSLKLIGVIKKSNSFERTLSAINHKAHAKAYFMLLFFGSTFQRKFQNKAIIFLNKGKSPVYPPSFSYE